MKKIIFYAPVGTNIPSHLLGGGEKGCRRTREILTVAQYEVITVDKPNMAQGGFNYVKVATIALFKIIKNLIAHKNAVLYIVGVYEKNIYMECLNVFLGKLFRHKLIYEARNGRLVKAYNEYGNLYKKLMDYILIKSDLIFCQGLEYVDFIKSTYHKSSYYTPNYVMERSLKPYVGERPFTEIKLIYFGRVSESKNIDIVIKTAYELEKLGYQTSTKIIGGYQDAYIKSLNKLIEDLNLKKVQFRGQQKFEVIVEELQNSHFFVFPSQEKMEGHSNSLTEAMTFGVVPVVSTAGFNESICGDRRLVLDNIDSVDYAKVIDKILKEKRWNEFSEFVYKRIQENYTEEIVKNTILSAIKTLI